MESRRDRKLHPAWWTLILFAVIAAVIAGTGVMFAGTFRSYVPVTLKSDRAGLVMEPGAKVKLRGVEVGRVGDISGGLDQVSLDLEMFPDQLRQIPSNVQAEIRATTAFGAKYVNLIYPGDPSPQRLSKGAVLQSSNVSTEVNTVFQNLRGVLQKIDPAKLNGVLSALAEGLRGQGERLGQAITDGNDVLLALNPRAETVRRDWQALQGFSDTYAAAAPDIVTVLDAASTTSVTITDQAANLDALLVGVLGLSRSGIDLLGPSKDNLVKAINVLQPTTDLLLKYDPQLTCLLQGGKMTVDSGFLDVTGGADGKSVILDVALLLGDDQYKYPNHLPIIGAKGGPGGKPGCGSLPDVAKNWPVRYLVTNTGWGTGNDMRVNPGIGFPGYANYFPVTRAVPEPPSIRNRNGPAIGPIPYPGAPPYGAPQYAPDGTPLYPGLPPAPPPGAPRDPAPPPGVEPFNPPFPAPSQPIPLPRPSPPPPPPPPLSGPAQGPVPGQGDAPVPPGRPLPAEAP
ncbi:MCE-family protein MCE3A [Mycolicibacterium duvalii]|uniref:Virulence factor n=1 Tax=Mycolicibacterium duvalii TaxID=39688 RepID=A0A7I7K116_9MYCO|nr:MCE family protein [Mycolicibacterium duvalii]MCV7370944.1 MCE family protein [Mycolicibacterium duvalii]PEG41253.1 MCE-family protein MCE3A [Mycolicibacterium duvalii]BBX17199.1 virulence factor [Mycolicibacterium duvalii]